MMAVRWDRGLSTFAVVAILALGVTAGGFAGTPSAPPEAVREVRAFRESESRRVFHTMEILSRAEGSGVQPSQAFDITHWDLAIRLDPNARTISGTVTMTFTPSSSLSQIKMRLHPKMNATEATLDGKAIAVSRGGADLTIKSGSPLQSGTSHDLAVSYAGTPVVTGGLGGGLMFGLHGTTASATTLSEPFASYAWWPCVDDVKDKATMEMHLTVPAGMNGASNGLLTGVTANSDGTSTYNWKESYPLSNYLISANVTNYATFSDHYTSLDGKTVTPIDYFVYPEGVSSATATVVRVPDMITYFASIAGEYPFLQEKYGMVAFPWGGGMEHQTLTSMGESYLGGHVGDYDGIYAHELAHMWWGDEVTCATWNDIWLNEGFATYYEVLWLIHRYGDAEGDFMNQYYDDGKYNGYLGGSVYLKSGNKPFDDTGAVYLKGAWVLHMLKGVVGEGPFNQALLSYRAAHALGNASTPDLRSACEAVYGKSLGWFFEQWVYTPKRPIYKFSWTAGTGAITATLQQVQKHKVVGRTVGADTYTMPVQFTLHFQDGTTEVRTVTNDQRNQSFTLEVSKPITEVGFDEGYWILKTVQ